MKTNSINYLLSEVFIKIWNNRVNYVVFIIVLIIIKILFGGLVSQLIDNLTLKRIELQDIDINKTIVWKNKEYCVESIGQYSTLLSIEMHTLDDWSCRNR
jgi:hypothetical protein